MLKGFRVRSGCQSGVDLGAIKAAKYSGIEITYCYMIKNYMTEYGPRPEYKEMYNAVELNTNDYPVRTRRNVQESDLTVWFLKDDDSLGYRCTLRACLEYEKPMFIVEEGKTTPKGLALFILYKKYRVINFAGSRESKQPGIEQRVENFCNRLFAILNVYNKNNVLTCPYDKIGEF
jgi:hypothetical protein